VAREVGYSAHRRDTVKAARAQKWQPAQYFNLDLCPPPCITPSFPSYIPHGITPERVYTDFFRYLSTQTKESFYQSLGKHIWQRVKEEGDIEVVIAHPDWWGKKEQEVLTMAAVDAHLTVATSKVHFVSRREAEKSFVMRELGKSRLQVSSLALGLRMLRVICFRRLATQSLLAAQTHLL
jgi:hypothetical protein